MNEQLWRTGIVESDSGPIAWPDMTRSDAAKLPPSPKADGVSHTRFHTGGVTIANTPFIAELILDRGPIVVILELDPAYARQKYQQEFPGAQELVFYEDLLEKFLGSRAHEQRCPWGAIKIAEDPWTHDPSIELHYRKLFFDHFFITRWWHCFARRFLAKLKPLAAAAMLPVCRRTACIDCAAGVSMPALAASLDLRPSCEPLQLFAHPAPCKRSHGFS
jgi:hypothetical protein